MLINNTYFHNKFQWNFNEIFFTTITLLVTLFIKFTYCSNTNSIFLCWLNQFKILFPTRKLIEIETKNLSKSIEISKTFDFYFRHRSDVFSRNYFWLNYNFAVWLTEFLTSSLVVNFNVSYLEGQSGIFFCQIRSFRAKTHRVSVFLSKFEMGILYLYSFA